MMVIKNILRDLRDYIRLKTFQDKWIKVRGNNFTKAGCLFPEKVVDVGDYTYGILNVHYYNQPEEHLTIGKYCSIANNVQFFTGGGHSLQHLTSYPFKNRVTKNAIQEATTKGPIVVGDDVWIGDSVIILSGVHIGKGAVIGAGSIIVKDIPPYAVYCGTEVKKFRFQDEEVRRKLEAFDLSKINYNDADKFFELLYEDIKKENIDRILEMFNK